MDFFIWIFVLLHVLPVGLAVLCAFSKRVWLHVPAILILALEIGGSMLASGVGLEGPFGAQAGWLLTGPLFLPMELLRAMSRAPLWVLLLLLAGAVGAVVATRLLWRRAGSRWSVVAGMFAGLATMWIVGEIAVETAMRARASEQFASSCNFRRVGSHTMLAIGLSTYGRPTHGGLTDGVSTYLWSFRKFGWVERKRCDPGEYACACRS